MIYYAEKRNETALVTVTIRYQRVRSDRTLLVTTDL
jgi:hypothetical protein